MMVHSSDTEQHMVILLLGRLQVEVATALVGTLRYPILEGGLPNHLASYLILDIRRHPPSHLDKFIIVQFWSHACRTHLI